MVRPEEQPRVWEWEGSGAPAGTYNPLSPRLWWNSASPLNPLWPFPQIVCVCKNII